MVVVQQDEVMVRIITLGYRAVEAERLLCEKARTDTSSNDLITRRPTRGQHLF